MYRYLCIVLALFVSVSTAPVDERFVRQPYVMGCKEAYNASDALFATLVNYPLEYGMDDPIAHCVVGCWLEEGGILKPDGSVNPVPMFGDVQSKIANVDELTEGFKQCADQPGEGCRKKYLVSVCLETVADRVIFWRDLH